MVPQGCHLSLYLRAAVAPGTTSISGNPGQSLFFFWKNIASSKGCGHLLEPLSCSSLPPAMLLLKCPQDTEEQKAESQTSSFCYLLQEDKVKSGDLSLCIHYSF